MILRHRRGSGGEGRQNQGLNGHVCVREQVEGAGEGDLKFICIQPS